MPSADHPHLFLAVFLGVAIAFALGPLALAWLWARTFSPAKPGMDKSSVYECGLAPKSNAPPHFKVQYYLYGIIFLVFDVEAVFLFPFAVAFLDLSFGSFMAIMVFLLLLVEGLAWAWMKGLLHFEKAA